MCHTLSTIGKQSLDNMDTFETLSQKLFSGPVPTEILEMLDNVVDFDICKEVVDIFNSMVAIEANIQREPHSRYVDFNYDRLMDRYECTMDDIYTSDRLDKKYGLDNLTTLSELYHNM
jgi:hypothetical protein